jgi:hypothetical protein
LADQAALSPADVAQLRSMLDQLESAGGEPAAQMGADTFAPDVGQQVAPDGTVTYDFDAHLHARGLDLDAGDTSTPPNDRRVRWLRTTDGAVVAQIYSYDNVSFTETIVRGLAPDGSHASALAATYDKAAGLSLVQALSGSAQRVIVDDLGQSDFIQGIARRLTNVDFGNASVAWPGASPSSNIAVVTHNLGRVPVAYLATMGRASNGNGGYMTLAGSTNTTLSFFATGPSSFAAGVTANFHWVAIA